ncbi:MAG: hypothetical protein DHS20C12_01910 [Pseudohongiella sp.]|nr:MAG: hypothetical protein DHS20C12_01910 [Pseudohongiella sp.]
MINSRRYDLDWLRILAFGVLIYFHTAIIFVPEGVPLIRNTELSDSLAIFVNISAQFRLSLLFFISGVGVAFARRRRTSKEFIRERSVRLLPPLLFSMLIVVPPMVYTEKLFMGEFAGSFLQFYPRYFTEGTYPAGNFSWHHLWFVAYLYLFCLLGTKVFAWLEDSNHNRLDRILSAMRGYWIFLPLLPLWCIELFLRPLFPGFRDLIHDWASFSHWFVVFVCGFLIAHRESLLDFTMRIRYFAGSLVIASTGLAYLVFGSMNFNVQLLDEYLVPKYFLYTILSAVMVWSAILCCLGMAGRFLRFSSRALSYLNEAVYPLFILHLPFIIIFGYWVVQTDWSVSAKFLIIANATLVAIVVIYHLLIRPFDSMRYLFGVRPKR